jgi:hypothetical protein
MLRRTPGSTTAMRPPMPTLDRRPTLPEGPPRRAPDPPVRMAKRPVSRRLARTPAATRRRQAPRR